MTEQEPPFPNSPNPEVPNPETWQHLRGLFTEIASVPNEELEFNGAGVLSTKYTWTCEQPLVRGHTVSLYVPVPVMSPSSEEMYELRFQVPGEHPSFYGVYKFLPREDGIKEKKGRLVERFDRDYQDDPIKATQMHEEQLRFYLEDAPITNPWET